MSLAQALRTGDLEKLPSRRDEDWRWTDLRGLLRILPPPAPPGVSARAAGVFDRLADRTVSIVNGRGAEKIECAAGASACAALRFIAADAGSFTAPIKVRVGAGARLTLLETHEGPAPAVCETQLDIDVGAKARFERIVVADEAEETASVCLAQVKLGDEADYAQTIFASGARRQRIETELRHGHASSARLDGLYLVGGRRHADITTRAVHDEPEATTDQRVKGLVAGQGRGVFQGRVIVRPGGRGASAAMEHHALSLSARAEVDAKPELEIFTDDVACSHGNTVGALDEEALFYAAQRGVPEADARAMLTRAFLADVVERVADKRIRAVLHRLLTAGVRGLA